MEYLKRARDEWKEKEKKELRMLRNEAAMWKYIDKKGEERSGWRMT